MKARCRSAGTRRSTDRLVTAKDANKVKKGWRPARSTSWSPRAAFRSMKFKDLGLMIVDEEQHFGVKQKKG